MNDLIETAAHTRVVEVGCAVGVIASLFLSMVLSWRGLMRNHGPGWDQIMAAWANFLVCLLSSSFLIMVLREILLTLGF